MDTTTGHADSIIREYMDEHGLQEWTYKWTKHTTFLGRCTVGKQLIEISRPLMEANGEDQLRQTVLHEIAHALTPYAGHGPRWVAKALELGVRNPGPRSACAGAAPRWVGTCPRHKDSVIRIQRLGRRRNWYVCGPCRNEAALKARLAGIPFTPEMARAAAMLEWTDTYAVIEQKAKAAARGTAPRRAQGEGTITDRDLPIGTVLVATYKGRTYRLTRVENGYQLEGGTVHKSPSAAGRHVTGTSVNGWKFWKAQA